AVLIGVALAAVVALRGAARTTGVSLEPIRAEEPSELDDSIVAIRFQGPLFFVSAERVLETARGVRGASVVRLRLSRLRRVDGTGSWTWTARSSTPARTWNATGRPSARSPAQVAGTRARRRCPSSSAVLQVPNREAPGSSSRPSARVPTGTGS